MRTLRVGAGVAVGTGDGEGVAVGVGVSCAVTAIANNSEAAIDNLKSIGIFKDSIASSCSGKDCRATRNRRGISHRRQLRQTDRVIG